MTKKTFKDLASIYLSTEDIHNVFGIILYSNKNPLVKKVLRDKDYWQSLDAISGPRWPVLAMCPPPGRYIYNSPPSNQGLQMMINVSKWE